MTVAGIGYGDVVTHPEYDRIEKFDAP